MNETEYLIIRLSEECLEVAKECHKAVQYGIDDRPTKNPYGPMVTDGPTTREKIVAELNDVMGLVEMLIIRGIIPDNWSDPLKQMIKRDKVCDYMDYAERVGSLQREVI